MKKLILLLLLSTFVVSCSSTGEKLSQYPRAEIEKPYTMPYDMKSWETDISSSFAIRSDDDSYAYINPLNWKTPLTDNFTLVWGPLPLGFDATLVNKEKQLLGLSFAYYFLGLNSQLSYRYRISDSFALNPRVLYHDYDFFIYEEQKILGQLNFIYQIQDKWSVSVNVGKGRMKVDSDFMEVFLGALIGTSLDLETKFKITQYGLNSNIYLGRQWDLNADLSQIYIEDLHESTAIKFNLKFTHYWD